MRRHHLNSRRHAITVILLAILAAIEAAAQHPFVQIGLRGSGFGDTLYWYAGSPVDLSLIAGPEHTGVSTPDNVRLTLVDRATSRYSLVTGDLPPGHSSLCVTATAGGDRASDCIIIVAEQPELRGGIQRWRGMRATVGRKYNPTSEWKNLSIPANHYQTIVTVNGSEVFSRPGTSFKDAELSSELIVKEGTREIIVMVYWKPAGTADRSKWVPLLSNKPGSGARIEPDGKRQFTIHYPQPEHVEGFEFDWVLSTKSFRAQFGPIVLRQMIGEQRYITPTEAEALCDECGEYGIRVRLEKDYESYMLHADLVDRSKLERGLNGKRFEIPITMSGRGASGSSMIVLNVQVRISYALDSGSLDTAGSPTTAHLPETPDLMASRAIRSLEGFKGRSINIYEIGSDLRAGIVTSIQSSDRGDIEKLNALGRILLEDEAEYFGDAVMQIMASHAGRRFERFRMAMGQRFGLEDDDLDDLSLQTIFQIARQLLERKLARPSEFHLVTTSTKSPRPLAIIGTRSAPGSDTIMVVWTIADDSMRALLDGIEKNGYRKLGYELEGKSLRTTLRRIWPQGR